MQRTTKRQTKSGLRSDDKTLRGGFTDTIPSVGLSFSFDGDNKQEASQTLKSDEAAIEKISRKNARPVFPTLYCIMGALCALIAAFFLLDLTTKTDTEFPCQCVSTESHSLWPILASARFGITGIHLHCTNRSLLKEQLRTLPKCVRLYHISESIVDVALFFDRLRLDAADGGCIVWIAEDVSVIQGVANSLKELLEDNSLRGKQVLALSSRGLFVLLSEKTREELKDVLPHRVVHMLRTVRI